MLPSLNKMAAASIITLPGIMTGQVLSGLAPITAATYQILLMFVLSAPSSAASLPLGHQSVG